MQIKSLIQQIQALPLDKRFLIIEETLQSIKKEEFNRTTVSDPENFSENYLEDKNFRDYLINEKSLANDWLSDEDNRWDNVL